MNAVFFNEYIQTSPRFMTDFTPWTLFVDTGIISVLLLLGKLMRVKIRFIQRLFIPPQPVGRVYRTVLGTSRFRHHTSFHPNRNLCRHIDSLHFRRSPPHLTKGSQRRCRQYRQHVGIFTGRNVVAMGFWRTVGIACPEPDMALEPCLRHHYAKRLLRRARYSSSHRTGFQPVRI